MAKRKKPPDPPVMTDAEIDRYTREINSIPVPIRIARSRRFNVEMCLRWRNHIKAGPKVVDGVEFSIEFMTFLLRNCQKSLLKLRIWRSTGQYPSSDG